MSQVSQQPNILLILLDDFGWRDTSIYGSTFYETPNVDRLAQEGMLFTDAYASCPVCSPTRASLMSGKYPANVGVTNWISHHGAHPSKGRLIDASYIDHLPLSETSLASALKDGGYATWHVGKWHLGLDPYFPDKHGFEVNIGGCEMGHPWNGYFAPWKIPTLPESEDGTYLTDRLTDDAIELIQQKDDRPFFLNMWYYTVHTPIQAKPELIAYYEEKARRLGLDKIDPLVRGEYFPCEHKKTGRVTRRIVQSDPAYAAMIHTMDENVGRLLRTLDETGQRDNTIVIFTSDNGGLSSAEGSPTCNAPLSEGKGWMYEGGTREPLIVRWPGQIEEGSRSESVVTSPDFYPTLLEAAGLPLLPEQHQDGVSFIPALKGEAQERGAVYWHYPHYSNQGCTPGSSVREGEWKLIQFFEDGHLELYNLRHDIGEQHNLVATHPEIVKDLLTKLVDWRDRMDAKIPCINPNHIPYVDPGDPN